MVLPSDERYSATAPLYLCMAVSELMLGRVWRRGDETGERQQVSVWGTLRRQDAPVEHLVVLAVALNELACALVVTGKHAAQHDKVGASTKGLGDVALFWKRKR